MQLWTLHRMALLVSLVVLSWSTSVLAAASISVTSSGSSSYTLIGSGMDGASGIQLDITYDATSLANPTVTQGSLISGAIFQANTTRSGSIKIAIISTSAFPSSGPIATITFASRTGNGGITSVIPLVIDNKGSAVSSSASAQSNDTLNTSPFSSTASASSPSPNQQATTNQTTQTPTTSNPVYAGTVSIPTDQQQHLAESQPATSTPAAPAYPVEQPAKTAEQALQSSKPAPEAKQDETPQLVVYKGIAERFKNYNGSKTLAAMVKLFDKKIAQTVSQDPSILVSDGKNKATLTVDIPSRITSSPNFAVNGGTLVSYKKEKQVKGRWTVVVQPNPGSNLVSITIIAGTEEFEYPLTTVQPIKTTLALNEKGWSKFSKEVGTPAVPQHDFNSDGVRNYLDEYIFVANYLARKAPTAKPVTPVKKPVK